MADKILIITGQSGAGKTTACARIVSELRVLGLDIAGVLTLPRFVGGRKVGMDVQDVRTGETLALAELRAEVPEGSGVLVTERWQFRDGGVSWGSQVIAGADPRDLLVIDEIGPVELLRGQGWTIALERLRDVACSAALVVVRPSLIEQFRREMGSRQVESVVITETNGHDASQHLVKRVLDACRPAREAAG